MLQPISAIIFDLGGVILNLDYNLTVEAFRNLGKENFDQLYAQSHQDKIFDRFETGEISAPEFRNYMRGFYEKPISDFQIDNAWNAMLLDLPKHRVTFLEKIAKQKRIFLFSNTNEIHFDAFRKKIAGDFGTPDLLESLMEKTYYSHLAGRRKPNVDAFQLVIDNHKLNPAETLFIDDSIQHIEGAKKLGIQTIHLTGTDISDLNLL
ncbi:MAG: HAD family phosphatase [Crocinitomicaceae bacterium]|nr:HAD family phosphatase [Crocinitomicaceae bacterium]